MPDQSTRDLRIHIDVTLEQAGPNPHWESDRTIPVPPAYSTEMEMDAFLRHELDRAMAAFEREHFEYSRAADIIHQFDVRLRVIANILRYGTRHQTRAMLAALIQEVLDLDTAALLARYGDRDLED